jgi:hypothetical protein
LPSYNLSHTIQADGTFIHGGAAYSEEIATAYIPYKSTDTQFVIATIHQSTLILNNARTILEMPDDWSGDFFDSPPAVGPTRLAHTPSTSRQHSLVEPKPRQLPVRRGPTLIKPPSQSLPAPDNLDDLDDLDIPDSFPFSDNPPPTTQRLSSKRSNHSLSQLPNTVITTNPSGTVTRLTSKSSSSKLNLPMSSVKARAAAIEQSYERDIDFGPVSHSDTRQHSLALQKRKSPLPPIEDVDDPDWGEEDEDQATLKAGATVKGLLPPKRDRGEDVPTVKPKMPIQKREEDEDSWENDFEAPAGLPLSLEKLRLHGSTSSGASSGKGWNGSRMNSAQSADWGSPSNASRKEWEDSLGRSETETSRTSISSGLSLPDRDKQREREMDHVVVVQEEDMEDGLIITEPTLFSAGSERKLNGLLGMKRRPGAVNRAGGTGDGSFEDGLVLSGLRGQLNRKKLQETTKIRAFAAQPRKVSGGRSVEEERLREKEKERGWGRHTPIQPLPPPRERTYSTLTKQTPRSQSATTAKEAIIPRGEALNRTTRPRPSMDSIAMPPPPIPHHSSSRQPPTPSPSKGLRHQKSQYTLPSSTPLPSPSLHRNRSQASLQHVDITSPPSTSAKIGKTTYSSSTSRLHDPTQSSASKARLPISHIFPSAFTSPPSGFGQHADRAGDVRNTGKQRIRGAGTGLEGRDHLFDDAPKKPNRPGNRGEQGLKHSELC